MTIQKSVIIMTNTTDTYDVKGKPSRADSYVGYSDGLHTVSVKYGNFVGNLHIQGTLSTDPDDETSWFDIDINVTDNSISHLEFNGESGINAFSFIGNFTFIRAVMSRSERGDLNPSPFNSEMTADGQGSIDRVILAI